MFWFGNKKRKEGDKGYSYTIPIIEDGEVTGCFMCRSDDKVPEMELQDFLEMMEGTGGGSP